MTKVVRRVDYVAAASITVFCKVVSFKRKQGNIANRSKGNKNRDDATNNNNDRKN